MSLSGFWCFFAPPWQELFKTSVKIICMFFLFAVKTVVYSLEMSFTCFNGWTSAIVCLFSLNVGAYFLSIILGLESLFTQYLTKNSKSRLDNSSLGYIFFRYSLTSSFASTFHFPFNTCLSKHFLTLTNTQKSYIHWWTVIIMV